jgi:hypothetical protein
MGASSSQEDENEKIEKKPLRPADNTANDMADKGMHNITCTDIPCCLIFLAFLVGMGYIVSYAFQNGDPRRLTHGFDYGGQLCGVDPNVSDKPFLFWCADDGLVINGFPTSINFDSPICVASCPTGDNTTYYCPTPSTTGIATTGVYPALTKTTTIVSHVKPRTSYPTRPVADRYCVPDIPLNSSLMQTALNTSQMQDTQSQVTEAIGSIKRAWPVLIGASVVALLLSFAFLGFLKTCALLLIYVAMGILIVGFGLGGFGFLSTSFNWTGNQDKNPLFQKLTHDQAVLYSQIGAGICFVISLCFLILAACCNTAIKTAVGCVEAACECMFEECELLLQPVLDVCLRLVSFFSLCFAGIWVMSVGNSVAQGSANIGGHQVSGVARTMVYTQDEQYMMVYYIFGYFWIMEWLHALSQFVISYVVVLWYYTEKNQDGSKKLVFLALMKGYAASVMHIGTLAFGSFLIACCRLVRLILAVLSKQAQASGNEAGACLLRCLACCVDCFKRFLEMINKNAYIDVAIQSNTFCTAAINSMKFMTENAASVGLLSGACFVFHWTGVALVSSVTGYLSYLLVISHAPYSSVDSATYVAVPEAVGGACGTVGLVVSLPFMTLFDQTADTLLYTFTWNKKNDPQGVRFYAPKTLEETVRNYAGAGGQDQARDVQQTKNARETGR